MAKLPVLRKRVTIGTIRSLCAAVLSSFLLFATFLPLRPQLNLSLGCLGVREPNRNLILIVICFVQFLYTLFHSTNQHQNESTDKLLECDTGRDQ